MTKEEIVEGNALIAEFLGMTPTLYGKECWGTIGVHGVIHDLPTSVPYTCDLQFHKSYLALAPVIIECARVEHSARYRSDGFGVAYPAALKSILSTPYTDIETIHKYVVKFIKLYNSDDSSMKYVQEKL
jgi:hypothetical protein